jgi:predicted ArsR family transcriptional regulator
MRNLNEIECFVKAVELKSLTAAAKALKLAKSKIRSKFKNLEERELNDLPDAVVSRFMRDARRISRALAG